MEIGEQKIKTSEEGKNVVSDEGKQTVAVTENELKVLVKDHVKSEIQKEIKFDKASLFTIFGIFASNVTFVSIEIQILKTLRFLERYWF